jgi:hypothetical protein
MIQALLIALALCAGLYALVRELLKGDPTW